MILGIANTDGLLKVLLLRDIRGIIVVRGIVAFVYLYVFAMCWLFLHFIPLGEGELAEG